jgi:hypothetical protein
MTCDCCGTLGLYDWNCLRCQARAYVRALPREREITAAAMKQAMDEQQQAEFRVLIEEERLRETGSAESYCAGGHIDERGGELAVVARGDSLPAVDVGG